MTTTYRGLFVYLCIFDGYYSEDRVEKKKKTTAFALALQVGVEAEVVRHSGDREEIPRGKLTTGYFGPVMVSLLGASAGGPTCYGRANIQWLLINAGTPYFTHT